MKKISNIFILTILGFVIFIGGVKAEEAKTQFLNSLQLQELINYPAIYILIKLKLTVKK